MGVLIRILFIFLLILSFVGMGFLSFFSFEDTNQELFLPEMFESLPSQETSFSLFMEGDFNTFVTSSNTLDTKKTKDISEIELQLYEPTQILSSIGDISKSLGVSGTGFTLKQDGIGEIYIDTLSEPGKVFIYPLTVGVHVTLTNPENQNEKYNTVYLTPQMYFEFQPSRNNALKNADIVRLQTLTQIGVVSDTKNLSLKKYIGETSKYQDAKNILNQKTSLYESYLSNLLQRKYESIGGLGYIERYQVLFLNNEKKKVYYKNEIVKKYFEILHQEKKDPRIVSELKRFIEKLQKLDNKQWGELEKILTQYNAIVFSQNNKDLLIAKLTLIELFFSNDKSNESILLSLYGNTFFGNTFDSQKNEDLFNLYRETFANIYLFQSIESKYFLYFLQESLSTLLQKKDVRDIGLILIYFQEYIELSSTTLLSDIQEQVTLLYTTGQIMDALQKYLFEKYFLPERDAKNLLITSQVNKLSNKELVTLKDITFSINDRFRKISPFLQNSDQRDVGIVEKFSQTKKMIDEYLLALENYESYTSLYDSVSKDLLGLGGGYIENESPVTVESIQAYLSIFSGLSFDSKNITLNDTKAKVEGLKLSGGRTISFVLNPKEGNIISQIEIDGVMLNFTYILDDIKEDWQKRYQTATEKEKDQFDFERFFLITFQKTDAINGGNTIFVEENTVENEDKAIVVYKRETLLGKNGILSSLGNMFTFNYQDIVVTRSSNTSFETFIQRADISFGGSENLNENEKGYFSGKLSFNEEKQEFFDLKVWIYENKERSTRTTFGLTPIEISGRILLDNTQNIFQTLNTSLAEIKTIYDIFETIGNISDLRIVYIPRSGKIQFRFDFSGKKYIIVMSQGKVENILVGTKKLIETPVGLSEIKNYIK